MALWAHDHHALWASRAALAVAGVDRDTPIRRAGSSAGTRTASRRASSTRRRHGSWSTRRRRPPRSWSNRRSSASPTTWSGWAWWRSTTRAGCRSRTACGLGIAAYRALDERDELPLRVHASIRSEQLAAAIEAGLHSGDPLGPVGGRARFGWLKLFADGTLASRTAALLDPIEPEEGRPLPAGTERGIWLTPPRRSPGSPAGRRRPGSRRRSIRSATGPAG